MRMPTGFIEFESDGSESPYDCSWRIVCPAGKQVDLLMSGLDTETQQDILKIWDGDVRMDQLLSELHGNILPRARNFISSGESIDMTFTSDGYDPNLRAFQPPKCGYPVVQRQPVVARSLVRAGLNATTPALGVTCGTC